MADEAPPLTREQLRSRRPRAVRAKTTSVRRVSKVRLRADGEKFPEDTTMLRPKTRGDCVDGPRPCPFASCRYNLVVDVSPRTGAIKMNFPDLEIDEVPETCALDVADAGGSTLEEVGAIMNLTRERVRQLEVLALIQVRTKGVLLGEPSTGGPDGRRALTFVQAAAPRPRRHLTLVRAHEVESDDDAELALEGEGS